MNFLLSLKMSSTTVLSDIWEHTLTKLFKHDPTTELGIILRKWVKYNKLEDFYSMLNYSILEFLPSGSLCYFKEKVVSKPKLMSPTPLKEMYNLRNYLNYLILNCEDSYDDDKFENPLDEHHWFMQTRGKFMKFVIFHSSQIEESNPRFMQKWIMFKNRFKWHETTNLSLEQEETLDIIPNQDDIQEISDVPSTTPDEVPTENSSILQYEPVHQLYITSSNSTLTSQTVIVEEEKEILLESIQHSIPHIESELPIMHITTSHDKTSSIIKPTPQFDHCSLIKNSSLSTPKKNGEISRKLPQEIEAENQENDDDKVKTINCTLDSNIDKGKANQLITYY